MKKRIFSICIVVTIVLVVWEAALTHYFLQGTPWLFPVSITAMFLTSVAGVGLGSYLDEKWND